MMRIKVRSQPPPGLIIKGLDNQAPKSLIIDYLFIKVSPRLSQLSQLCRRFTGPNLTVDRIKIIYWEYHIFSLLSRSTAHHPDFHWLWLKNRPTSEKKWLNFFEVRFSLLLVRTSGTVEAHKGPSGGGSVAQKRAPAPLPDAVRAEKMPKEEFNTH